MKKIIYLIVVSSIIYSCMPPPISSNLVSTYPDTPFFTTTDKSFNQAWDKIIDVFAQKGIGINTIDKSSGLIISTPYSFVGKSTMEKRSGVSGDSTAWVAVGYYGFDDDRPLIPTKIEGNFNIRVKEENGKTVININLTNLKAGVPLFPAEYVGSIKDQYINHQYDIKSTGVFERYVADMIK